MRVINRYLLQDFLVIFGMTLLIFTFVMSLGVVLKAIDFAARGVSGGLIFKVFLYNVPFMMTFSIPMSTLTGVLLLFGRLSFDGELTAMKASGVKMWEIISPVVLMSMVCAAVCLLINVEVAPRCRLAMRQLLAGVGVDEPVTLIEAGRFIRDFPGLMIFVGERNGDHIKDVVVYELGADGPVRNVRATSGEMKTDYKKRVMNVELHHVRIEQTDKKKGADDVEKAHYINAETYPVALDFSAMGKKMLRKKMQDLTYPELLDNIRDVRTAYPELKESDLLKQRMSLAVESNKRLALSISCFAFTLLGIPLGMRSKRRESSVGIGISLALVFVFYLFIVVANTLSKYPEWRPDLIVWLPVLIMEALGFWMISRTE